MSSDEKEASRTALKTATNAISSVRQYGSASESNSSSSVESDDQRINLHPEDDGSLSNHSSSGDNSRRRKEHSKSSQRHSSRRSRSSSRRRDSPYSSRRRTSYRSSYYDSSRRNYRDDRADYGRNFRRTDYGGRTYRREDDHDRWPRDRRDWYRGREDSFRGGNDYRDRRRDTYWSYRRSDEQDRRRTDHDYPSDNDHSRRKDRNRRERESNFRRSDDSDDQRDGSRRHRDEKRRSDDHKHRRGSDGRSRRRSSESGSRRGDSSSSQSSSTSGSEDSPARNRRKNSKSSLKRDHNSASDAEETKRSSTKSLEKYVKGQSPIPRSGPKHGEESDKGNDEEAETQQENRQEVGLVLEQTTQRPQKRGEDVDLAALPVPDATEDNRPKDGSADLQSVQKGEQQPCFKPPDDGNDESNSSKQLEEGELPAEGQPIAAKDDPKKPETCHNWDKTERVQRVHAADANNDTPLRDEIGPPSATRSAGKQALGVNSEPDSSSSHSDSSSTDSSSSSSTSDSESSSSSDESTQKRASRESGGSDPRRSQKLPTPMKQVKDRGSPSIKATSNHEQTPMTDVEGASAKESTKGRRTQRKSSSDSDSSSDSSSDSGSSSSDSEKSGSSSSDSSETESSDDEKGKDIGKRGKERASSKADPRQKFSGSGIDAEKKASGSMGQAVRDVGNGRLSEKRSIARKEAIETHQRRERSDSDHDREAEHSRKKDSEADARHLVRYQAGFDNSSRCRERESKGNMDRRRQASTPSSIHDEETGRIINTDTYSLGHRTTTSRGTKQKKHKAEKSESDSSTASGKEHKHHKLNHKKHAKRKHRRDGAGDEASEGSSEAKEGSDKNRKSEQLTKMRRHGSRYSMPDSAKEENGTWTAGGKNHTNERAMNWEAESKRRGAKRKSATVDEDAPYHAKRRVHEIDGSNKPDRQRSTTTEEGSVDVKLVPNENKVVQDLLTMRTGGAYIPPAKLRMMQAKITDKSSIEYQRIAWEALKKSINGLVNKVNVSNIGIIVRELFKENIVRGRGLLCRSVMQAQAVSPTFAHVYAAFVAVINTKFPQIGELMLRRLIIQFRRGFRRNDKQLCLSSTRFIAHLVNQQVAHEVVALEILTLLLETPTEDAIEVAIGFMRECGMKLSQLSRRGIDAIFERLRSIIHDGKLDKRVQYMIEVMFAIRKDGFKDHPDVIPELDLIEEADQFTHLITLEDATNAEEMLNVFKFDPEYEANEDKYKMIKKEIVGDSDDESGSSGSGSESDDEEEDNEEEEGENGQQILDKTETNLVALRRTIYLTIQSSLDFEECAHKLLKLELKPGQVVELCHMILDCCAQQRTYEKFFGLLAQRFCQLNKMYAEPFEEIFRNAYDTIHRFETNKLRNVAKFFAHLLYTDAIPWTVLSHIRLNEEETTSSSRIFIKILFQELCEYMGLPKLNDRVKDPTLHEAFDGLFSRDNPRNTRFAINFFTSIGLGGLTDELREHLRSLPKPVAQVAPIVNTEETNLGSKKGKPGVDSSGGGGSTSSTSSSSESDSSGSSTSSSSTSGSNSSSDSDDEDSDSSSSGSSSEGASSSTSSSSSSVSSGTKRKQRQKSRKHK